MIQADIQERFLPSLDHWANASGCCDDWKTTGSPKVFTVEEVRRASLRPPELCALCTFLRWMPPTATGLGALAYIASLSLVISFRR